MCGFVSIASPHAAQAVTEEMLRRMNETIVHRGPDGDGFKLCRAGDTTIGLGHRRLSIIDLAGGAQPMTNEDGTVWVTYNGEIYNHAELRRELEARGHQFQTRCDTEAIVHAYEEWGTHCVDRFRGMFAFVVWDQRRRQLFAARDRLGIKPLYYVHDRGLLLCASEAKSLFASGLVQPELAWEGLPEFLALGHRAGDGTLFRGVQKLMPGHHLIWREGAIQIEQYWDVPLPEPSAPQREEDLVEEFQSLFEEAVRLRLMSDVPLGVFLSGGLDSSAIAATMAAQMSAPVQTFSVGFESQYYSEFEHARVVAQAIGAEHHETVLKPDDALRLLPRLVWHEDEPIRFPAAVPLYQVSRLAEESVKVVLTGEGSDELFAGYDRHWATDVNLRWGPRYGRVVPDWFRDRCVRPTLWRWPLPLSVKKKISHTFVAHSQRPEEIIFDNFYAIFPPRVHADLFSAAAWDQLRSVRAYGDVLKFDRGARAGSALERQLYFDQKSYLVELLTKQDRMSMATSIESRVPFLDHKLVEFAARVPAHMKLRGRIGKYLVKRGLRKMLPASIVDRPKMGFPMPLGHWFRHGFHHAARNVLLGERTGQRGIFSTAYVTRLLEEHRAGQRDHTEPLWLLMNFELWARVFLDGQGWPAVTSELLESSVPRTRARGFAPTAN